jgi:chemotaxis regulatin CheY-phosphate phosphatase CheZ
MALKHQAWPLFLALKHAYDIRRSWFHFFDDHIESHLFKKMGKKKSDFLFTPSTPLASHARDSDEILSEVDEFLSLNLFQ